MSVIIRLQNLPWSANASNIRRFFSGMNIPEGGVHIVGGENGDAFIGFSTDDDARRAMLLDGQALNGSAVRLMFSSLAEMQVVIAAARAPQDVNTPASQHPYPMQDSQYPNDYQQQGDYQSQRQDSYQHPRQRFPAYQNPESESSHDPSRRYTVYEPPTMGQQRPAVRDYQARSDPSVEDFRQTPRGNNQPPRDFNPPPREYNQSSQDFGFSGYGRGSEFGQENGGRQHGEQSAYGRNVEEYMPPRPNEKERISRNHPEVTDAYGYNHPSRQTNDYDNNAVNRNSEPGYGNGFQSEHNEWSNNQDQFGHSAPEGYSNQDQFGDRFNQTQSGGFRPRPFETNSNENFDRSNSFGQDYARGPSEQMRGAQPERRRGGPSDQNRSGPPDQFRGGASDQMRGGSDQMRGGPPDQLRGGPRDDMQCGPDQRGGPKSGNRWGGDVYHDNPASMSGEDRFRQMSRWGRPESSREDVNQFSRQPQFSRENEFCEGRQDSENRDFSVKPPWLQDSSSVPQRVFSASGPVPELMSRNIQQQGMKRSSPGNGVPPPFKAPRANLPEEFQHNSGASTDAAVIRLTMSPASVTIKKIFSLLWGVHIMPKWGVRIEMDNMNRPTGYVLVKLSSSLDCDKAVTYTGKKVDGVAVKIDKSTDEVFYSIVDKSRTAMSAPVNVKTGPSLYLQDKCIELTGLVPNINKKELLDYLGVPHIAESSLFIGGYGAFRDTMRGFIKVDSEQNVNKILQRNNTSFQGKCTIKACSISELQRDKYISEVKYEDGEKKVLKPPPRPIPIKPTNVGQSTKTDPSPSKPLSTTPNTASKSEDCRHNCLELTNLPKFATLPEVRSQVDPSTPRDRIRLQSDKNRAFVEFGNELECRRSLSISRRPLRGCMVKMRVITRGEMIKETSDEIKSEENVKPLTDTDHSSQDGKVSSGESRFSVSICNLPMHYTVDKVREFFKGFALDLSTPIVLKMSAQGKPLGEGSVFFKSAIEADRAIRELKGCRLAGREVLLKYES